MSAGGRPPPLHIPAGARLESGRAFGSGATSALRPARCPSRICHCHCGGSRPWERFQERNHTAEREREREEREAAAAVAAAPAANGSKPA